MKIRYLSFCFCLILIFLFSSSINAQTHPPKREFRGVWIATVKNIDWPSKAGLPSDDQKLELTRLLDLHKENGFNAVILQIRPGGDAFYESSLEPWSRWLTGEEGRRPYPYYDPLTFAIKESHLRGMEFHAWINPFRAALDWDLGLGNSPEHIAIKNPEWFIPYGKNLYFDPGIPEAREYVRSVVMDIVNRYDIDAIHFDDYFYPYKIAGELFDDSTSFINHAWPGEDLADWRRNNVSHFIRMLSDSIRQVKPWVKLGISPFGVWRNQADDPRGSATRAGQTSYDDLYADILKWLREGWIDYVAPQIYFSIGYPPAAFDVLVDWWSKNSYGRNLYIGHAAYKVNNNPDVNWKNPAEIPRQIKLIRQYRESIQGSIFFSSNWFPKNPLGITDSLRENLYYYSCLLPVTPWIDALPPVSPVGLETDSYKDGIAMIWENTGLEQDAEYYAIYRAEKKEEPVAAPEYLLDIVRGKDLYYLDRDTRFLRKYTYAITALDRNHNESKISHFRSQRRWSGWKLFRRNSPKKHGRPGGMKAAR